MCLTHSKDSFFLSLFSLRLSFFPLLTLMTFLFTSAVCSSISSHLLAASLFCLLLQISLTAVTLSLISPFSSLLYPIMLLCESRLELDTKMKYLFPNLRDRQYSHFFSLSLTVGTGKLMYTSTPHITELFIMADLIFIKRWILCLFSKLEKLKNAYISF